MLFDTLLHSPTFLAHVGAAPPLTLLQLAMGSVIPGVPLGSADIMQLLASLRPPGGTDNSDSSGQPQLQGVAMQQLFTILSIVNALNARCTKASFIQLKESAAVQRLLYCGFPTARCFEGVSESHQFMGAMDFRDTAADNLNVVVQVI